MPDVPRHAGEEDIGVAALEPARHRHLRNAVALPEIFAQEKRVNAGGVAAHDHILVVVGENLRLDEVARAEQLGDRAGLAHGAKGALLKSLFARLISALQFLPCQGRNLCALAKTEMPRHIGALKTGQRAHPDIVKLREQKRVDEMPAIDRELRIIDRLLRDLQPRRTRTQKPATASPIEFRLRFPGTRDQIRQIETKKIVTFDHVRIAFLNQAR